MRKLTINVLPPITLGVGIWLCSTGRVSWWVLLLVVLTEIKLNVPFVVKKGVEKLHSELE